MPNLSYAILNKKQRRNINLDEQTNQLTKQIIKQTCKQIANLEKKLLSNRVPTRPTS